MPWQDCRAALLALGWTFAPDRPDWLSALLDHRPLPPAAASASHLHVYRHEADAAASDGAELVDAGLLTLVMAYGDGSSALARLPRPCADGAEVPAQMWSVVCRAELFDRARAHARVRAHAPTCTHARARTCTHTHTRTRARSHACTHAQTHTHARPYTHRHTQTHTHTHTHTHMRAPYTHTDSDTHRHTQAHARADAPTRARTGALAGL
jgi:hypothetical protein